MDTILGIDNNETKTVGISNESGGITGTIDYLSDNNSNKSSPLNSPTIKPSEPNLGVTDTMGINLLGSKPVEESNMFSQPEQPEQPTEINLQIIL